MSPEIGQAQNPKIQQSQEIRQIHGTRRGSYGSLHILGLEDEYGEEENYDETAEYEDFEEQEDDAAPGDYEPEEADDPSFVPALSLFPAKWLWIPCPEGSRLLWATMGLVPRLDAVEIFRRLLEETLKAVYFAEKRLFPKISQAQNYFPPSPLDLEKFFLGKWLQDLVKVRSRKSRKDAVPTEDGSGGEVGSSKSSKQFQIERLAFFTIAVPIEKDCFFIKPDSLIYGVGSPKGAGTLRMALLKRWAKLEIDVNGWKKEELKGSGKFLRRTKDYVDTLNIFLGPLLGEECFKDYESHSLSNVAKKLRDSL